MLVTVAAWEHLTLSASISRLGMAWAWALSERRRMFSVSMEWVCWAPFLTMIVPLMLAVD